jgi:hypothetical protein
MHRRGRLGARTGEAKAAPHLLNVGAFPGRALAKLKLGRISQMWDIIGARPCHII